MSRLIRSIALAAVMMGGLIGATGTASAAGHKKVNYGKEYLSIITPLDKAGGMFQAGVKRLKGKNPTASQLRSLFPPYLAAYERCSNELAEVRWPGITETDVHALVTDMGAIEGVLSALNGASVQTMSGLVQQLDEALGKESAAAALVRGDLGLPPAKG